MQQAYWNVPVTIMRAMNEIFADIIFQDIITYVHDIIILSSTCKEFIDGLTSVLQLLQKQQCCLRVSSISFSEIVVKFLCISLYLKYCLVTYVSTDRFLTGNNFKIRTNSKPV